MQILLPRIGFLNLVQELRRPRDHVLGHRAVDFAGQFDEPRVVSLFASQPGKVKRVDRDAMPTQTRSGIKRVESKWLGLGRIDHFPDVDVHRVEQQFSVH